MCEDFNNIMQRAIYNRKSMMTHDKLTYLLVSKILSTKLLQKFK